jgi:hypothetical protein
MTKEIQEGDWVRFYQGGKMVIDIVQYIEKDLYSSDLIIKTTMGSLRDSEILEMRRRDD